MSNKVEKYVKQASSFDELNMILSNELKDTYSVPDELNLTLRQVLLRHYAEKGPSQLSIYNSWLKEAKSKM